MLCHHHFRTLPATPQALITLPARIFVTGGNASKHRFEYPHFPRKVIPCFNNVVWLPNDNAFFCGLRHFALLCSSDMVTFGVENIKNRDQSKQRSLLAQRCFVANKSTKQNCNYILAILCITKTLFFTVPKLFYYPLFIELPCVQNSFYTIAKLFYYLWRYWLSETPLLK
jgi:hypothetical protein